MKKAEEKMNEKTITENKEGICLGLKKILD